MSNNRQIRTLRWLCAIVAVLAVTALTAAADHFGMTTLFNRALPCLVFCTTVVVFVAAIVGLFAPQQHWQYPTTQLFQLTPPHLDPLVTTNNARNDNSARSGFLIIYVFWTFAVVASRFYVLHQDPTHSDPAAFLRFAEEVRGFGGPLELVKQLYNGQYTQANQHPLVIGILSLNPTLTFAKSISLCAGFGTLLLVLLHVYKKHGVWPATLVITLLSTNSAFVYFATLATCESLLILIMTSVWVLLDWRSSHALSMRRWFFIGALLGLAYLAKGTAPIFLTGVVAGCFVTRWTIVESSNIKQRLISSLLPVLVVCAGWIVVAHPLLIRNVKVYDNPLYSANQTFFYMDSFPNGIDPFGQVAAMGTPAEIRADYLATHTLVDMTNRAVTGTGWQSYIFIRSLGPTPLDDSRVLFGVIFTLLAGLSLLHESTVIKTTLAIWIALSLLLFGWYIPIAAGQRFMAPLLPLLLAYAGVGMWRVMSYAQQWSRTTIVLVFGVIWNAIWLVWTTIAIWP
ncbi:MAG: hypothetical protein HN617_08185 [Planctomycetaceae bacterium]|jgi:hypothetical protein|nr:hypothetical protein [Planctomycetaceae bacterium]MBT4723783.1 hypothetical protein [Planctomycetaceae bacterium]MBT4846908.1 hypothetical protein [Planctomycetaceae bacterium]MBT5126345.1 hypothetical protein [Planctomycetaceae bacterium]MBT5597349.1 hypothetical protein [Planctomycetaceae bacterium]